MTNAPQICPTCNYENAADAQICVRCGTLLLELSSPSKTTREVVSDPPVYRQNVQYVDDLSPNTLAFLIEGQQEPRLVQNAEKVLLGRVETIGEMYLLDFTLYGGQFQGVSRRHAIITRSTSSYTIEDQNSTNGTWINETRLQPHQPHTLKNGDAIRLGKLTFRVYFKTPRVIDEFLYLQKPAPEQPLTLDDLSTLINPYLGAVSGIQKVVNTLLGQEKVIVSIQAIEQQDQMIRVHLTGASEAIQFLKTKLDSK